MRGRETGAESKRQLRRGVPLTSANSSQLPDSLLPQPQVIGPQIYLTYQSVLNLYLTVETGSYL